MVEKSIQVVRVMMVMHTKDQHTTHNARQCGIRQRKKKNKYTTTTAVATTTTTVGETAYKGCLFG
jgi:hypothetical protein